MREADTEGRLPDGVIFFRDDDDGFFAWLEANPDGYVVNSARSPRPAYLVLHQPACPHFKGAPQLNWTREYVKHCSNDRKALEVWAAESVGGELTPCGTCFR